jgi:hypothetical protein
MRFTLGLLLALTAFGSLQGAAVPDLPEQSSGYKGPWPVPVKEKWGYIDVKGKLILPAIYADARLFREGKAAVEQGNGWTFISKASRSRRLPISAFAPFRKAMLP